MPTGPRSIVTRALAALAVGIAVAVVLVLLLGSGGPSYRVHALFEDAGQLVQGDRVTVGGIQVGTIARIGLDSHNRADVTLAISDPRYDPLHEGTTATIRSPSLSTEASRFVSLAPGPNNAPALRDGATIGTDRTTGIVDLDELFATLDYRTRSNLQDIVHGSATAFGHGRAGAANRALAALDPALAQTQLLADQLLEDQDAFTTFVVASASVVSALEPRDAELEHGIASAAALTRRVAGQDAHIADALERAPAVLDQARGTLADVERSLGAARPALRAAQPVAPLLASVLRRVVPVARRADPVVDRLSGTLPDLSRVLDGLPELDRRGSRAFRATAGALKGVQPIGGALRAYLPDVVGGLLNGFGGNVAAYYDANGRYARIAFMLPPDFLVQGLSKLGLPVKGLLNSAFGGGFVTQVPDYCPGASSTLPPDGSAPFMDPAVIGPPAHCDPSQVRRP